MSDAEDVTAGTYELSVLQWDQQTSKPGEPFDFTRHRRGDLVELDVAEARRLVRAGAVARPGDLQRAQAERAQRAYLASMAVLSPEAREAVLGAADLEPAPSVPPSGEADTTESPVKPPAKSAPKAAWVKHAIARGMAPEEAAAATKDHLVETYGSAAGEPPSLPDEEESGPDAPSLPVTGPIEPPDDASDDSDADSTGDGDDTTDADQEPQPPAKSAKKAEWVDYAVSQGWAVEDAEAATVQHLQSELGFGD